MLALENKNSSPVNKLWIAALSVVVLIYLFIESREGGDWLIFMSASSDIFNGVDVYTKKYIDGYHYFYSVLFGIFLKPLTFLPLPVSRFLWLLLNAFFLFRIFKISISFFNVSSFSNKQKLLFILVPFFFCLRFILDNFHLAQLTVLMLYLSLEGVSLIFLKNKWYGAAFIALGINIKLLPLVLIPLLLYRRKFFESVLVIVFTGLFYFLPALFIGWDQNMFLLKTWASLINPVNAEHILDVEERSFHGLSTLLSTLLVAHERIQPVDIYQLPLRRNIADVDLKTLGVVLNGARFVLVSLTLLFLRTLPFKKSLGRTHSFTETSYILLIIPLIFPHQQAYAFLFMLPAVFCIVYFMLSFPQFLSTTKGRVYIAAFVLVYLTANLKLLLGAFNEYYEHYKILTYGALMLIVLLYIATRQMNSKHELKG